MGVWIETARTFSSEENAKVTPFVGVWIETESVVNLNLGNAVTPFVGVWIETKGEYQEGTAYQSHPSWVCGLKHYPAAEDHHDHRHTLRGCVD